MATSGITYDMTSYLSTSEGVGPFIEKLETLQVEAETLALLAQGEGDRARMQNLESIGKPLPSLQPLTQLRDPDSMEKIKTEYLKQMNPSFLQTQGRSSKGVAEPQIHQVDLSRIGRGYCSAGGFVTRLMPPEAPRPLTDEMRVALKHQIYDRDCQTPREQSLVYRGRVFEISCVEADSKDEDVFELINMCHPIFYGFFPTTHIRGKAARGVALCDLPAEVTFSTGQRRVDQTNRECGLMTKGVLNSQIKRLYPGEGDESLQMASELAQSNPQFWEQSVSKVRAHCSPDQVSGYSSTERTSCKYILKRISAIETLSVGPYGSQGNPLGKTRQ